MRPESWTEKSDGISPWPRPFYLIQATNAVAPPESIGRNITLPGVLVGVFLGFFFLSLTDMLSGAILSSLNWLHVNLNNKQYVMCFYLFHGKSNSVKRAWTSRSVSRTFTSRASVAGLNKCTKTSKSVSAEQAECKQRGFIWFCPSALSAFKSVYDLEVELKASFS